MKIFFVLFTIMYNFVKKIATLTLETFQVQSISSKPNSSLQAKSTFLTRMTLWYNWTC